ncbi:MAG: (2Fe-2S) ferredoxin domain-containing protein, partial [Phycisphaerales bacterium]|nr:(2Fe-2S) ferredoxin domain-containing protein [Phycisphaerales bacterium]
MTPEELQGTVLKQQTKHASFKHIFNVCMESGCVSCNSGPVADALEAEIKKRGLEKTVAVKRVGCLCLCAQGPMIALDKGETLYKLVTPKDAPAMLD